MWSSPDGEKAEACWGLRQRSDFYRFFVLVVQLCSYRFLSEPLRISFYISTLHHRSSYRNGGEVPDRILHCLQGKLQWLKSLSRTCIQSRIKDSSTPQMSFHRYIFFY
jgi:hypothetical protein